MHRKCMQRESAVNLNNRGNLGARNFRAITLLASRSRSSLFLSFEKRYSTSEKIMHTRIGQSGRCVRSWFEVISVRIGGYRERMLSCRRRLSARPAKIRAPQCRYPKRDNAASPRLVSLRRRTGTNASIGRRGMRAYAGCARKRTRERVHSRRAALSRDYVSAEPRHTIALVLRYN